MTKADQILCQNCGKPFSVKPYRKAKARFCSCNCWTQSEESRRIVSNTMVKRHLEKPPLGNKSPTWKGGIVPESKYRLTRAAWIKTKRFLLMLRGNKCEKCGSTDQLVVHHKIPWRQSKDDSIENLQILCNPCHCKTENASRCRDNGRFT
jgi:5-methylcytosine-specific restriction endonuclease McrA